MELMKNKAKVLLWQLPETDSKGHAIRGYLRDHGIAAVSANPMDSGRTLSAILGVGKGNMGKAQPLPKEPVMVIYGFDEEQLDEFLGFLRQEAPVELKAVATVHNLKWTLGYLAGQLMAERAYYAKRN